MLDDKDVPTGKTAPLWRVVEYPLETAVEYGNPYADVEVTAAFHGPGGERIQRPAFWDGGRIWRVRFAPTVPGTWRWTSVCSNTDDAGLHDQSGELTAVAMDTDVPLHRHGFLRVSVNGRHFVHADGTPFFWLGDTHWQMPDRERVDVCNHPDHVGGDPRDRGDAGIEEKEDGGDFGNAGMGGGGGCPHGGQFQHLLADRIARGFTAYQTYPNATSAHWWGEPFSRIDPERFRAVFDVQMDCIADAGIVIALGCGHFNNSTKIPAADLCRFARYLVARYGAHPVVWITCQEMNAPVEMGGKESNRPDVWKAVAEQIARDDGYRHPHSAHQWVLDVDVDPLGQEPWHTWFALQGGHRNSGLTPQARYRGYYDFRPTRPVLETEAMYERVDCGGVNTTEEARQSAWKALLCGSPGYTYGGAGIWFIKWDADDPGCAQYNHAIGSWHEGMDLPGAAQMTVLKQFFTSMDWTALRPRFNDPAWAEWTDAERCALATIGNRLYLAYCYGDSSEGILKGLDPRADYAASWIDPRTGEETPIAVSVSPRLDGTWPVPTKPVGDWLLRVMTRHDESTLKPLGERPAVGAIRWDAWSGGEVTRQVEKTLGPLKYQARLPWFAQVSRDRDVRIAGGNQETMDREIAFAVAAGLDYWAFLLYPEGNSMSDSLHVYLDSARRRSINFCLVLHNAFGVPEAQWPRERDRALALLREPGYQTVCGGRPLVYAFGVKHQGVFPEARFTEFRQAAKRDGLDPYCVYMGWNPQADCALAAPWGFEAVSHYAACSADAEFAQLVHKVETDYWAAALAARVPYVPLVTTGWDKHPRRENPVSWERDHDYHTQTVFPATATPDEIARHLGDACAFVRRHPTLCPANTVILYAWNEHDEGGWLCPTWTPGGKPDASRLHAIAAILRSEAERTRSVYRERHGDAS